MYKTQVKPQGEKKQWRGGEGERKRKRKKEREGGREGERGGGRGEGGGGGEGDRGTKFEMVLRVTSCYSLEGRELGGTHLHACFRVSLLCVVKWGTSRTEVYLKTD